MADPSRPQSLATRGYVVPSIDLCMSDLQCVFPHRSYPTNGRDRFPCIDRAWHRGGTSPGGADFTYEAGGAVAGSGVDADSGGRGPQRVVGSYAIGWPELEVNTPPHTIVWVPPSAGQERFAPEMSGGVLVDAYAAMGIMPVRPVVPGDEDPAAAFVDGIESPPQQARGDAYGAEATAELPAPAHRFDEPYAATELAVRIVPLQAHLWGSDWDDTEELAHHLMGCWEVRFGRMVQGERGIVSGGFLPDRKADRGLHYVLGLQLFVPVMSPLQQYQGVTGVSVGVAPFRAPR